MDVSLLDFNYLGAFWTKDLEGMMMDDMHHFWYIKTQTNNNAIAHEQKFFLTLPAVVMKKKNSKYSFCPQKL